MTLFNCKSIDEFLEEYKSERKLIEKMMSSGMLRECQNCSKCHGNMVLRKHKGAYEWRCRRFKKDCTSKSVRAGSKFAQTRISLRVTMCLLHQISNNDPVTVICKQWNVNPATVNKFKGLMAEIYPNKTESNSADRPQDLSSTNSIAHKNGDHLVTRTEITSTPSEPAKKDDEHGNTKRSK